MANNSLPNFRIGSGTDIHQLKEGRQLIIGGVHIPSPFGALGHSDADVLLHAICDALLGAVNLRDIGFHFPDTDPRYKDADSKILLKDTFALIQQKGYALVNLDSTVLLENPKVNPHIPKMQLIIAEILKSTVDQISIKATRGEKMGFVGKGLGVQAFATVLIYKI